MRLDGLKTRSLGRKLLYFKELASTNAYVKEQAAELEHGCAVIAARQTGGRGRLNRRWHGSGGGLYMSLLLRGTPTEHLQALPLVTGLAVLQALEGMAGKGFALKWSNDVLFGEKKVCGILCESRLGSEMPFAVLGIGVNLTESREDFDRLDLVYATSVKLATDKILTNLDVAAGICNQFEPLLELFNKKGFAGLRQSYVKSCVTVGKRVRVISGGLEREATALDISGDGGLVCDVDGSIEIIRAGEASVRGIYGYGV